MSKRSCLRMSYQGSLESQSYLILLIKWIQLCVITNPSNRKAILIKNILKDQSCCHPMQQLSHKKHQELCWWVLRFSILCPKANLLMLNIPTIQVIQNKCTQTASLNSPSLPRLVSRQVTRTNKTRTLGLLCRISVDSSIVISSQ